MADKLSACVYYDPSAAFESRRPCCADAGARIVDPIVVECPVAVPGPPPKLVLLLLARIRSYGTCICIDL